MTARMRGALHHMSVRTFVRLLLLAAAILSPGAKALATAPEERREAPTRGHWLRFAQQQPDKENESVPADPNLTTASYGDWVLRCERSEKASPSRICDVAQTVPTQDLQGALAQISIAKHDGARSLRVYGLLPANITLPGSATMRSEEGTPELELNWRRCLPSGCVSEGAPSPSLVERWKKLTGSGQIVYKDARGLEITVPVSFRGLRQALDALDKQE